VNTIPEPVKSPLGPKYEGRLLPRADEDVVDQGAAFDIQTLISRRVVLSLLGLGAGATALAACTTTTTTPAATTSGDAGGDREIPEETAGPFPGDGTNGANALDRSGIVRSDIRSSIDGGRTATGVPIALTLTILNMADDDAPFENVAVYVWHCDAAGGYSMYSTGLENETYLRGVQVAGSDGTVTYTSVFPGCYTGRWPHIHFEVYPTVDDITDPTNVIATSQVALTQSASETVYALDGYPGSSSNLSRLSLATDMVFRDDGGASQLATITGDVESGYQVDLTVRVDTRTAPGAQR